MINHFSFGVTNFKRATEFYEKVFHHLGYQRTMSKENEVAFGPRSELLFWLYPVETGEKVTAPRMHIAINAPSREAVGSFFEEAMGLGARAVRPPGERPDISTDYYGTIIDDLDGHRIEVVVSPS